MGNTPLEIQDKAKNLAVICTEEFDGCPLVTPDVGNVCPRTRPHRIPCYKVTPLDWLNVLSKKEHQMIKFEHPIEVVASVAIGFMVNTLVMYAEICNNSKGVCPWKSMIPECPYSGECENITPQKLFDVLYEENCTIVEEPCATTK